MSFRNRIKFHLVKTLSVSYKEAESLLSENRVRLNGIPITENRIITKDDEISVDQKTIREKKNYTYIAFYKPPGIETTLNKKIDHNLTTFFANEHGLFPIGRLDKASEGLLLMTDNGRIFDRILKSDQDQEKEYLVTVNKELTDDFLNAMRTGIIIMGKRTKPAHIHKVSRTTFRIILTQGLNRQIRRMCFKFDYEVLKLVRTRIINIELAGLNIGEQRNLSEKEEAELLAKVLAG